MHKLKLQSISLALLCALPATAGAQEGLRLKSQPNLLLLPPAQRESLPLFIEADRVGGHAEKETEAEGSVRLRRRGQAVFADRMRYDKPDDEVSAQGNVRLEQGSDVIEGARLRFNLTTERGFMDQPDYLLHREARTATVEKRQFEVTDARGTAERMLFEGPKRYRAERANYTTCGPGNDDWYVRARELEIDKTRDVGTARDASIVFMDTPIFWTPYLSFSLHEERKSGFLTPHYGNTSTGGAELTVPFYWNIAPNYDATLSPRIISRRGAQLNSEFRYLDPRFSGEAHIEGMPDDRVAGGRERHAYFAKHTQYLPYGWLGVFNLNRVSDDKYFTDLSTKVAITSQVLLPNDALLARGGTWNGGAGTYAFSAFVQKWQTLQVDPLVPVTPPYDRLPHLTFNATRPEIMGTDFDLQSHFVAYDHPTLVSGKRLMAYPSLSLPLRTPYGYFTTKVGVNSTRYTIDSNASGYVDRTRTLPIATADAGLTLERPLSIGGGRYLQTLEPRLYYVYIPFREQGGIPNFDSGQQDINLATIFSENQFAGWDRINDANQITLGMTSRLIATDTGAERLRAGVAQRFYFATQQVTLPGVAPRTSTSSDLLAALSGLLAPHWYLDTGMQYSTNFSAIQKFNLGTRYQPAPGKVLNLSYRETVSSVRQTDLSLQWPLRTGWTALGRWNYSLLDSRSLETLVGIEYNGDCWALRAVAHRFATATQQATTTFFIQLELNGVSRIGSNPLETLRRNIGGFVRDPRSPSPQELRGALY